MHMRRSIRGIGRITLLAVALNSVAVQPVEVLGQLPPPTICKATITSTNVASATKTWVTGPPTGWQYNWSWSVDFTCGSGNFTNCQVDKAVSISYWDSTAQSFGPENWEWLCSQNFGNCTNTYTVNMTTKSPVTGGYAPGTIFLMRFYAVPHDGTKDCYNQAYDDALIYDQYYEVPGQP